MDSQSGRTHTHTCIIYIQTRTHRRTAAPRGGLARPGGRRAWRARGRRRCGCGRAPRRRRSRPWRAVGGFGEGVCVCFVCICVGGSRCVLFLNTSSKGKQRGKQTQMYMCICVYTCVRVYTFSLPWGRRRSPGRGWRARGGGPRPARCPGPNVRVG